MTSATVPHPPEEKPGLWAWLSEAFWALDVAVLAMLAFFAVISGAILSSTGLLIAILVLGGAYGVHMALRRRSHAGVEAAPEQRHARERRGF